MQKVLGIGDKFYMHQEDKDDTVYEVADFCLGLSDETGNYETYIVCIDGETLPIFMVLSLLKDGEMYIKENHRPVAQKLREIRKRQRQNRQPIGYDIPGTLERPSMHLEGPLVDQLPETAEVGDLVTFNNTLYEWSGAHWKGIYSNVS